MQHMGQRLEELLVQSKMSKTELAEACNRSKQWVWEVCRSGNWMASTILTVAKGLKKDPADLLPREL